MNTQEQLHKLQLPSDFLLDNYKTLQRRGDFEDMIEDLDDLQHEAMAETFNEAFKEGQINILRQFVEGRLEHDCILEFLKSEDAKTTQYEFGFKGDTE